MSEPLPPSLKRFIWDIQSMVELDEGEREILFIGRDLMRHLVATDDCLPAAFSAPSGDCRQFQLFADGMERFTVVSTILAPGEALPLYQESVWEIVGVLRGSITRRRFAVPEAGAPLPKTEAVFSAGAVDTFSPKGGDALQIANASADAPAVTIHVYGGEIGRMERKALAPDGSVSLVITGYANGADTPPYDIHTIQTEIRD